MILDHPIAGIDLGQSNINPTTGISVMDLNGKLLHTHITHSLEDVIKILNGYDCASVYIDAPIFLRFDEKEGVYLNRQAESVLIKRKNKYCINKRFSPMPANMLAVLAQRAIILKERVLGETSVKRVFEVHPRTSCEYMGIEHYKTDLKKFIFRFHVVSGIDTREIVNEHILDSIICAFTGYLRENNRCIFIGHEFDGVITVPAPANIRCVFFDMDGTITFTKSPWQRIFEDNGIWHGKGDVFLQEYLDGQYDYAEFCRRDIALWQETGINTEMINASLNAIKISEYAVKTIKKLAGSGIKCVVISTGFYSTAKRIADLCGLKFEKGLKNLSSDCLSVFANHVFDKNGKLSSEIDVYADERHKQSKGEIVKKCLNKLKISPVRCLSVGDSLHSDKALFEITGDFVYVKKADDVLKLITKADISYNEFI